MSEAELALGRQALKSKITREKILNSVISLIKEGGFSAASASKIAERAGITWGAAQHHFGSKEEILDAVMQISHDRFAEIMSDPALRQGSLPDRVALFVDRMWQHYEDDLYLAALEILLASRGFERPGTEAATYESRRVAHLELLRDIFHDITLSDDRLIEALIFVHCLLTGLTLERLFEPEVKNVDRHLNRAKLVLLSVLNQL